MKKLMLGLLVLGFLTVSSGSVFAGWFAKEQPEAASAVKAPAVTQKAVGNVRDAINNKKAAINGTQWIIEVKPMSGKGKAERDVLRFADNKISSKNMEARGYVATNFSMRILEDNETYTWETMQVSEKEGVAFWRGDICPDGVMPGVVSLRNKNDVVTDFNFNSKETSRVAVAPVPVK